MAKLVKYRVFEIVIAVGQEIMFYQNCKNILQFFWIDVCFLQQSIEGELTSTDQGSAYWIDYMLTKLCLNNIFAQK